MRIAICDDEKDIGVLIGEYLREWFDIKAMDQPEYAFFSSGEELLASDGDADIVFLDVQMEGISGIDTGQKLKERNPNVIIFMETSYLDYLDDAMRFHVFRYLTKPIDKKRLFRNMEDALNLYQVRQRTHRKIQVKTQSGISMVNMSDIVYIEAKEQKTHVRTRVGEFVTWTSLQEWMTQLDMESFFQTYRSFLVNMEYVTHFDKSKVYLCDGKYCAYLANRKYKQFKEAYFQFMNKVW